jgi:hypothetical protein
MHNVKEILTLPEKALTQDGGTPKLLDSTGHPIAPRPMSPAQLRAELGRNIRGMREALKLKLKAAARQIGWPHGFLNAVERGTVALSKGQQDDLARWVHSFEAPARRRPSL